MKKKQKEEQYNQLFSSRSKLSNAAFIKWIRSHINNNTKHVHPKYLSFPQQLIKETSIQKIFVEFDSDGSGGLSRTQVFDMFNNFGIKVTMEHLDQLYDSVEANLQELNCEKFKKCALSEQSNRVFRKIVQELGMGYFPHNFVNMIIYIVFLSKRQQIKNNLNKPSQNIDTKVTNVQKLLKLNDLSLNNERLVNHTITYKQNIKNQLRDIWQTVNERYNQQFPYTPKLQDQFFEYCQHRIHSNKQNV